MGLQECNLNLNRMRKELQPHGTPAFPCAGFLEQHTTQGKDDIPWHWHEEMEIIYIESGCLCLEVPNKCIHLQEGDCYCINANVLHFAMADPACELHSLVFHPLLVTGEDTSIFASAYIDPLLQCAAFDGYLMQGEDRQDQMCVQAFVEAFQAFSSSPVGYEFMVREKLSQICLLLYKRYHNEIRRDDSDLDTDSQRMKKMLAYIHDHYADEIELAQIAEAANVGVRECLRCFKRIIRSSPMQYVMAYRMKQGAAMLLQNRSQSISDIAIRCGFESSSNFAQLFKRYYTCTPSAYRNKEAVRHKEI